MQDKKRLVIKTDNLDEFKRVCQENGVSMTAMVKILIAEYLKKERA